MVGVGILGILLMVIILFAKGGMDFWVKGIPTKPQDIVSLVLEGEVGKRSIEDWGLVPTIRGGYSVYDRQFDSATTTITLGTSSIIIGFGIVDGNNGFCNTTRSTTFDLQIITQGSATTTDFTKGTPTITVVSPYCLDDPYGTHSQILETTPAGDDYGLAIGYQFIPIQEIKNGKIYKQGRVDKSVYHKNSAGVWSFIGSQTIAENINQLEFRYFTDNEEVLPGTPTALGKISQINTIMITLAVDNDDDRDGSIEEDKLDGIDNDSDGKIDEDYFNGMRVTTRAYFRNP